ncbi:RNA polymerase I associated factor A49-like protein [Amylostereum chailletii]|nr:RNA polymerase I associated factor A49-like protein [Amylostereum chailletii]
MSSPSANRKRKRGGSDASEGKISLHLSDRPSTQIGPVLASFPALHPPRSTPFECYVGNGEEGKAFVEQHTTVAGESETVEFSGSSHAEDVDLGSRYYVALYRPSLAKVVLQPAPLHIMARQVKAHKNFVPRAPSTTEFKLARTQLGETFGTKKAQAAIRAYERNKVDVGAMEQVAGALQSRIEEGTENLPTKEEATVAADEARLVPAYNPDANTPEDAYPLHNIIPEQEWNALDSLLPALKEATTVMECLKAMPFARSTWLKHHLGVIVIKSKVPSATLKMLVYIASLISFRNLSTRNVPERASLLEKMAPAPEVVVDGLLSRFSETARASSKAKMTPAKDTLLLTHTFALCLKVDHFATDFGVIASDLKLPTLTAKQLFKTLACRIEEIDEAKARKLSLPSSAVGTNRAILKTPLVFPKPKRKRR